MSLRPTWRRRRPLSFRTRLLAILTLLALVPALVLTLAWSGMAARVLPIVGGIGAWEAVVRTGDTAIEAARTRPGTAEAAAALDAHEALLDASAVQARRTAFLGRRIVGAVLVAGLLLLLVLAVVTSRVAGHLSRQLSRPLDELVGWTDRIARDAPLPSDAEVMVRGAPEFGVLRDGMRRMAAELEAGRRATVEAERLGAFRESARQVAHELKNPLTPIRYAVAMLQRSATPEQREVIDVLDAESARLEAMATSFAQFGRLPDAPMAPLDLAALVRAAARHTLPADVTFRYEGPEALRLDGQHEALQRAVANLLLNAVHATEGRGTITITLVDEGTEVALAVTDDGCGIPASELPRIWEPYVTRRTGGTGLGLAIVKQTVLAHGGRVAATSTVGAGTTITLHLPRRGG